MADAMTVRVTTLDMLMSPEVQKLASTRGYDVQLMETPVDVIIGPNCHYLTLDTIKHLPIALKGVRARKKAEKKGTK